MGHYKCLCALRGPYGPLLVFMQHYVSLRSLYVLIRFYGSLFVGIGLYASLWVFMSPYKSLCIFIDSNGYVWSV